MSRITILTELRGKEVEIELSATPPDRSVGIMGWGYEEETITDGQGNLLSWELTDAEEALICDKVAEYMEDDYTPEEDYDYMKDN